MRPSRGMGDINPAKMPGKKKIKRKKGENSFPPKSKKRDKK